MLPKKVSVAVRETSTGREAGSVLLSLRVPSHLFIFWETVWPTDGFRGF